MKGHIRRRGTHSWELKFDAGTDATGGRRTRYVSFKGTKREAQVELARLVAANAAGQGVDPSRETVADFLARWQEWARDHVAPKTAERYGEIIKNNVLPNIGSMQAQRLRPAHLVELYAKLGRSGGRDGTPLAPRTVGHVHRLLRRALGHAVTWGATATNAAASVKPPRVPDSEIQILSESDIAAVLRALNGKTLRTVVSFLLGTGCRRGEALALRWSDVDLDTAVVRIERSLEQTKAGLRFKSPKTRTGRRAVTISTWLVAELRAHRVREVERRFALGMGAPPDDALVFGKWDGAPRAPHAVTTQFRLATAALGIKSCTLHALRHTHVSQLIASGLDVLTIGRRVGHSSAAVTLNVYGHLIAGQDAKAAAVMEKAFAHMHDTN
jgi:integrase